MTLHVIETPKIKLTDVDVKEAHELLDRMISQNFPDNLGGIIVMTIGLDWSFSHRTTLHPRLPFGKTMLPAIVAEILRRDTMESVIDDRIKI